MKTEEQFTRFLRYLAGEASAGEVAALNRLLGSEPAARSLFLKVSAHAQSQHRVSRARRRIPAVLAVAAAVVAVCFILLPRQGDTEAPRATAVTLPDYFSRDVSWDEVFESPLNYPPFVWRAELESGDLPGLLIDDTLSAVFPEPFTPAIHSVFHLDRISLIAPLNETRLPTIENLTRIQS